MATKKRRLVNTAFGLVIPCTFAYLGYSVLTHDPTQDIRAPRVQDTGVIGAAFVEDVTSRTTGVSRSGNSGYRVQMWVRHRFRVDGAWVTGSARLDQHPDGTRRTREDVMEKWFLVAYAPEDPDTLEYLMMEWPLDAVVAVTATVTSTTTKRIPKARRFAFERDTGVRVFRYELDGTTYTAEEHIGPASEADIGQTVTAVARRDAPSRARIVDPSVHAWLRGERGGRGGPGPGPSGEEPPGADPARDR